MVEKAAAPAKGKGIFFQSIMKSALKFCKYADGETQNKEHYKPLGYPRPWRHFHGISELRSALSFRHSAL